MKYLIVNSKNYPEVAGKRIFELASVIEAVKRRTSRKRKKLEFILAVPAFCVQAICSRFQGLPIFCQHLDASPLGSSTGFLVPELARSYGAHGSIVNHSEHQLSFEKLSVTIARLKETDLKSLVCARTSYEVRKFALLSPDFIAVEPPELIGTGRSVSKAKPQLIVQSVKALEKVESNLASRLPVLLCGAGIVSGQDAKRAVELGTQGILVSSGVVRSQNWKQSIEALADGIINAESKI